jgi:hypothetical protein
MFKAARAFSKASRARSTRLKARLNSSRVQWARDASRSRSRSARLLLGFHVGPFSSLCDATLAVFARFEMHDELSDRFWKPTRGVQLYESFIDLLT